MARRLTIGQVAEAAGMPARRIRYPEQLRDVDRRLRERARPGGNGRCHCLGR